MSMQICTLCYLLKEDRILLGMKKKGFGVSKYNGFGGKLKTDEAVEDACIRELFEEAMVKVKRSDLDKVAVFTYYFPHKPEWNQMVYAFFTKRWEGIPKETDEMKPEWFDADKLPLDRMWGDDPYWLPFVLKGKKFKGSFTFSEDGKVIKHELEDLK